tara:strand:+ start:251 stop:730 length:480 start_codon:yes stop_codon:yes gene_type:complete
VLAAGWFVYAVVAADSFCHLISPFAENAETAVVDALALLTTPPIIAIDEVAAMFADAATVKFAEAVALLAALIEAEPAVICVALAVTVEVAAITASASGITAPEAVKLLVAVVDAVLELIRSPVAAKTEEALITTIAFLMTVAADVELLEAVVLASQSS